MRVRTALAAPAALALVLAVPAPADALGCGGAWTFTTSCAFSVPVLADVQITIRGEAIGTTLGRANVTVAVYLGNNTTPIHTCSGRGLVKASCSATTVLPFAGVYTCRVGGTTVGTYSCTTG